MANTGIYQKHSPSGSIPAPSSGSTLIGINEYGQLYTKDSGSNIILYPTGSGGGGPTVSASYALSSSWANTAGTASFVTASNVYGPLGSSSVMFSVSSSKTDYATQASTSDFAISASYAPGSGITVETTTITGGTNGRIPYNSASIYKESSKDLYFETSSPYSHVFAGNRSGSITGVNNTLFGYQAGYSLTSAYDNTNIGYQAGKAITTGLRNINIGSKAGSRNISGNDNIMISSDRTGDTMATGLNDNILIGSNVGIHLVGGSNVAIGSNGTGGGMNDGNVAIGYRSMWNNSSSRFTVAIGYNAGYNSSGNGSTYVGNLAGFLSTYSFAIGLGHQAIPTQNNELMIGGVDTWITGTGDSIKGIQNVCIGNGSTYSSPSSVTIRVTGGSGTNISGGTLSIASGKSTGNANPGSLKFQTSFPTGSGTTLQILTDRYTIGGAYKSLTDNVQTEFAKIHVPVSSSTGGKIIYAVECISASNSEFQIVEGTYEFAVINKAGTITIWENDINGGIATSGSLNVYVTGSNSGSNFFSIQVLADSSFTPTTLQINSQIWKNIGSGSITFL